MRAAVAVVGAAVGLVGLGACCPIPIDREVTVRPQLHLTVEGSDGAPVVGATITARRLIVGPPPLTETARWTGNTGPGGKVVLAELKATEPHMPLMMHGVNWYGWQVCAEHGGAAGVERYDAKGPVVGEPVKLEIALVDGQSCDALLVLD